MTSTVPFQVIDDDDDEFDWEAVVREIDASCERANSPSSTTINQASSSNFTPPVNILNNSSYSSCTKTGTCKQSTLDKFIGRANPPVKPTVEVRHHQGNGIINSDGRPCCVEIDAEAAKTWIYPVNVPLRDYQLAITKTALFTNTLVALPTGLGKTLTAAVVMYNYFRWFPDGNSRSAWVLLEAEPNSKGLSITQQNEVMISAGSNSQQSNTLVGLPAALEREGNALAANFDQQHTREKPSRCMA
ncbi:hypothetical protein H0E87_022619 [Populus deltoides]|uniref:Helicase ATP-binding domain-containing protein n=1 Tax=Populus deltoides TaxID=3696 RepID=A0A8T2XAW9_POPDE|nr:hypothetical protein H0E87_022619 [Populus deltoides]